jgi:DNA polymerase-3 subunit epsilon
MREVVLDTETTGLDPQKGDRVVEIGLVELINHVQTGVTWQSYIDPERDMPEAASNVSGITADTLRGAPRFIEIADTFLDFLGDSPLVIHNAPFDLGFLNMELGRLDRPILALDRAVDTLQIARRKFPGAPASLDALCKRFGIDLSERVKHGALLDARLTAEVYLELIGGRQSSFGLNAETMRAGSLTGAQPGSRAGSASAQAIETIAARIRPQPLPARVTEAEREAHQKFIAELGPEAVWLWPKPGALN